MKMRGTVHDLETQWETTQTEVKWTPQWGNKTGLWAKGTDQRIRKGFLRRMGWDKEVEKEKMIPFHRDLHAEGGGCREDFHAALVLSLSHLLLSLPWLFRRRFHQHAERTPIHSSQSTLYLTHHTCSVLASFVVEGHLWKYLSQTKLEHWQDLRACRDLFEEQVLRGCKHWRRTLSVVALFLQEKSCL